MTSITKAVQKGVRKAAGRAPRGVSINVATHTRPSTRVSLARQGCAILLCNWVVNARTGEAKCMVCVSVMGRAIKESTLSGGTIEEVIQAAAVGLAMGAYDDVPK